MGIIILDELLKSDEVRLYSYLKFRPSNWQYNSAWKELFKKQKSCLEVLYQKEIA
jgi:hypothetical protein